MPVRALSGVGAAAERALASRGIRTLGDLAGASDALLAKLLGKQGAELKRRAAGRGGGAVEVCAPVKSVSNEMSFAEDLVDWSDLEAAIATTAAKVGRRLRKAGLRGLTLSLRVRYGDRTVRSVQRKLPEPSTTTSPGWAPSARCSTSCGHPA